MLRRLRYPFLSLVTGYGAPFEAHHHRLRERYLVVMANRLQHRCAGVYRVGEPRRRRIGHVRYRKTSQCSGRPIPSLPMFRSAHMRGMLAVAGIIHEVPGGRRRDGALRVLD